MDGLAKEAAEVPAERMSHSPLDLRTIPPSGGRIRWVVRSIKIAPEIVPLPDGLATATGGRTRLRQPAYEKLRADDSDWSASDRRSYFA